MNRLSTLLRSGLLLSALLGSFAASAVPGKKASPSRPNILFIAVDDLRPELGCYGVKEIQTPNIDALAAGGVTFNRAYCQQAVCNPSRASLMTGLRPDSTRVWDLVTNFRDEIPDVVTLPQQFMKHGYHAAAYGKIYHNPIPDPKSWNEPNHWPKKASTWTPKARQALAGYRAKMKADGKSAAAIRRMRATATEIQDIPDSRTPDGEIADQALAAMRKLAKGKQPFFLAVGFIRPHLPFVAPRKYWDLYDRDEIPLASNPLLPRNSPTLAMNTMYELRDYFDFAGTNDPRDGALTEAQQRRLKHGYYASVSLIDAQVGRLLKQLEELDLQDDTVVVLWGDHGWKLGEHRSWCKQTNYEIDARAPLIVRAPKSKANGRSSDSLVEFIDIYPTLCDLAGVPKPDHLEGRSMTPLLDEPDQPFKAAAFSQFRRRHEGGEYMGYAMRTGRHRLIEWIDRKTARTVAAELYDHLVDPHENTNIAEQNTTLVKQLARKQWSLLPRPKPMPEAGIRPRLTIRNRSRQALTVFWLPPEGKPRRSGVVEPGKDHRINTTMGHRFEIRGTRTDFKTTVAVKQQRQTFTVNAGKRPLPAAEPRTAPQDGAPRAGKRPNILFFMADDWSYPHAGALGDRTVKTPHFDRIAKEGVLFPNAFVSTPSCTPSRLSILTGQHHWRLREGDSLGGSLREDYPVYTELLRNAGYQIGRYGKGVWPSQHTFRKRDSFGPQFRSFDEFLIAREDNAPFCFWFGGQDPHRLYELGIGAKSGIDLKSITPPACLPDTTDVRSHLADYYWEAQRFDRRVGEVLDRLEQSGEMENTLIVVSGDNGMPFPRAKAALYDLETRVPLAVRWGAKVRGGRTVTDFVSLCDLAPTFLEAAGLRPAKDMTGRSLMPQLTSKNSGQIDPKRNFVLTGMERHVYPRPSRAIRTRDFLYIRKFAPDAWPTGEVEGHNPTYDFAREPWPTEPGAFSFNIDPSPSKQTLRLNREKPGFRKLAQLAFTSHEPDELYDLRKDPDQLDNVAGRSSYRGDLARLKQKLNAELHASEDPRIVAAAKDGAAGPSSIRPNVLFISVDDLNDWIGCLGGHPQARTPNFDRLAASSVLFRNAHCPAPACNPSRTAIMTGISPHVSGLYENGQKMREILPDATLLPKYFADHGYWAAGSGKLLHYFIDARSWDEYFPAKETENPFPRTLYPDKRPVSLPRGGPWQYVETDWGGLDVTDEEFGGDWLVSKYIGGQLARKHDNPFFLACGLYRPHEPWFVPQKYFDLFPLENIQLPPGYDPDDLDDVPPAGRRRGPNRYFAHIRKHDQWKRGIQGYLASIAFADAMLGRTLDALETGPNRDNTIVVLWSDHGWHLGEKQHWQKFTAWRVCSRVPLMIRAPKGSPGLPQGTQPGICDRPVNLLSLFPTLTELAGLPRKADNDGPSLAPLLLDPQADWEHVSMTHLNEPGSLGVSGENWRYIRYKNGDEELYHIKDDPFEHENLAGRADQAERLAEFRALLPGKFAPRTEALLESLPKLGWIPATRTKAPPSNPDGGVFDVIFVNQRKTPVQLYWMDLNGAPKPYGGIEPGGKKRQQTRPGAVWLITDERDRPLGHFPVGDRKSRAVVPAN